MTSRTMTHARTFHLVLIAIALTAQPVRYADAVDTSRAPNFIFILADDLGWGDLGCYGHPFLRTPHLDRLAREGTRFTEFYVNGSVCSPSRAAFMTGQYPARHRMHGHLAAHEQNAARGMPDWLDPQVPLVTRFLKQAGYATAHFGKWHLGSGDGAPGLDAYAIDAHRTVNANGPGFECERDPYFRARSTDLIVDEAIRFLERHREQPFFMNLWTLVPHATLHPTQEQLEPYKRFAPGGVPFPGAQQIYYASVTSLDTALGRLFEKLEELELAENTIVLFSSDNGPEDIHIHNASHSGVGSPGPLRGRKRSLYDGGVRVPFIVRWPGHVPAGRLDEKSVVSAVDVLPTVCHLARVDLPDDYHGDGENVANILQGESRSRQTPLFWEWRFRVHGYPVNHSPRLAVRERDWKLLLNPDRSRVELYSADDRLQIDNVAAAHSEVVERLAGKAIAWQATLPAGPIESQAGQVVYGWPEEFDGKK